MFQLLRIVCGFVLALLVCGLFLAWGLFRVTHPDQDPLAFIAMTISGLVGASVIGATVLVPAAVLIVLAEAMRLRSLVFHVAAAGGLAFLIWTLGSETGTTDWRPGSPVVLAAGFMGGAVYWLIAGRKSGTWFDGQGSGKETQTRD
ncbi:translation initiation factor IF-3 [Labrenzia sp. 011]|nr:translation initiation factor IF-3 [Labrenzia sp. 011]